MPEPKPQAQLSRRDEFALGIAASLIARNGLYSNPHTLAKQVLPYVDSLLAELDKQ